METKMKMKKIIKIFSASKEQGLFRLAMMFGHHYHHRWKHFFHQMVDGIFVCDVCGRRSPFTDKMKNLREKKYTEKFYDLCILFCCFVLYKIFNSKFFFWKLKFSLSFFAHSNEMSECVKCETWFCLAKIRRNLSGKIEKFPRKKNNNNKI
mgnify:CR=1 FL=1